MPNVFPQILFLENQKKHAAIQEADALQDLRIEIRVVKTIDLLSKWQKVVGEDLWQIVSALPHWQGDLTAMRELMAEDKLTIRLKRLRAEECNLRDCVFSILTPLLPRCRSPSKRRCGPTVRYGYSLAVNPALLTTFFDLKPVAHGRGAAPLSIESGGGE